MFRLSFLYLTISSIHLSILNCLNYCGQGIIKACSPSNDRHICYIANAYPNVTYNAYKIGKYKDENDKKRQKQECANDINPVWKSVDTSSQRITKVFCIFDDTKTSQLYAITFPSHKHTLKEWIAHSKKDDNLLLKRILAAQIASGISYLHEEDKSESESKGICNLNSNNIIIDESNSARLTNLIPTLRPNPILYTAPEVLKNARLSSKGREAANTHKADMWSFGVILYEMYFKKLPFLDESSILTESLLFDIRAKSNIKKVKDLIEQLLDKNPQNRPTIEQVKQHDYFAIIDWELIRLGYVRYPSPYNLKSKNECGLESFQAIRLEPEKNGEKGRKHFLGGGGFAKVFLYSSANDKALQFALKRQLAIFEEGKPHAISSKVLALTEYYVLEALQDNPFVVPLYCTWLRENRVKADKGVSSLKMFFLMGLAAGGTLKKRLVTADPKKEKESALLKKQKSLAKRYLFELIYGLHLMHKAKFVHLDLKPENLLLSPDDHVWMTDFNLSKYLKPGETLSNNGGTPPFKPPEKVNLKQIGHCTDYWSVAGILYYFHTEQHLQTWKSDPKPNGTYNFSDAIIKKDLENVKDKETRDFLAELLVLDPKNRLGCRKGDLEKDYQEIIGHGYFKNETFTFKFKGQDFKSIKELAQKLGEERKKSFEYLQSIQRKAKELNPQQIKAQKTVDMAEQARQQSKAQQQQLAQQAQQEQAKLKAQQQQQLKAQKEAQQQQQLQAQKEQAKLQAQKEAQQQQQKIQQEQLQAQQQQQLKAQKEAQQQQQKIQQEQLQAQQQQQLKAQKEAQQQQQKIQQEQLQAQQQQQLKAQKEAQQQQQKIQQEQLQAQQQQQKIQQEQLQAQQEAQQEQAKLQAQSGSPAQSEKDSANKAPERSLDVEQSGSGTKHKVVSSLPIKATFVEDSESKVLKENDISFGARKLLFETEKNVAIFDGSLKSTTNVKLFIKRTTFADENELKSLLNNVNMLSKFNHPFILHHFGHFVAGNVIMSIDEAYSYGPLRKAIQSKQIQNNKEAIKRYIKEAFEAIETIHEHDYAYLQLSPDTILINEYGHLKLQDMRIATKIPKGQAIMATSNPRGRPAYMAPEQLKEGSLYGPCVDWWAFAITIFEMITGSRNLEDPNNWKLIPDESLRDLLQKMLVKDSRDRVGCDPIYGIHSNPRAISDHPFFVKIKKTN